MDLHLKNEFDGVMKNTENAQMLTRIYKEKGKKAINTAKAIQSNRSDKVIKHKGSKTC